MKKLTILFLSLAMVIGTLTVTDVFAANNPTIYVEEQTAFTGKTVDVNVSITDNPGILGATLKVEYGDGITLQGATSGDAFSALVMTKPGQLVSGCKFVWDGQEISEEDIKDGTILTLTFLISDDATTDEMIDIEVSCENGDFVDSNLNNVTTSFVNGGITPTNFMYGDLNIDQKINVTDIILLRRFIAGGYDLDIEERAADVNQGGSQKGKINSADIVILRRYVAGVYEINSLPYPIGICTHNKIAAIEYKAATCTEEGNIAYWYCERCGKYFSNSTCTREITLEDTKIEATGHKIVVIPGKAATTTETGLTDGKQCETCGYWEVEQEIIGIPYTEVSVRYNLGDTRDSYLATQTIVNNNPDEFDSTKGLTLQNLEDTIPGYTFLGWYDGFGDNAEQIKKLPANEYAAGSTVQLYAHWEVASYNITYVCGDNMYPQHGDDYLNAKYATYKTNTGLVLPKIGIDKYYFVGWTTENGSGDVITKIEPGTTGDIILYANWTSYRNSAVQKTSYDDPIIVKDPDAGQIVFAYEIGQLNNVPLYEYFRLQAVGGVISEHTETDIVQFTSTEAKNVTSAISLATINSQTWGLSEDWNDVTTIDPNSAYNRGYTPAEAEEIVETPKGGYSLTSANGGSLSVLNSSGTSSTLSGSKSHNTFNDDSEDTTYKLINKPIDSNNQETVPCVCFDNLTWMPFNIGTWNASVNAKTSYSTTDTNALFDLENTKSYISQTNNTSNTMLNISASQSASSSTSYWNSSESYNTSSLISKSKSISNILSTVIADKLGYGLNYVIGGTNCEFREESYEQHTIESYSNTFVYDKMEAKEITKSFATTCATTGDYRLVEAGTVHVFGVVAYDVETEAFSVYTYSILDDETYEYLDYSTDGTFDDYEYGAISFDVPFLPYQYVTVKTFMTTDGLTINDEGIVTSYTGNDTFVYIPTYYRKFIETSKKYEYIKVVGIADGVFTGNENITGILLGDYVESIGDNAFKGCIKLETISCSGLKTIGKSAFEGCVALGSYIEDEETKFGDFILANGIESIGENAFKNVESIVINASSKKVALEATKSGAKNIKINLNETGVIFDANGGTLTEEEIIKTVSYGSEIGELPTPTRDYYTFVGWFDAVEDGNEYVATDIIESTTSVTLYAHWTQNEAKWALATEVPEGAEILSKAWDCDITTVTTRETLDRTAPIVDGFTLCNTVRTGWGLKEGPVYSDPTDGYRNVTSESYISGYETKTITRYSKIESVPDGTQTLMVYDIAPYYDIDYTPTNIPETASQVNKGVVYYGVPSGCNSLGYYICGNDGYWHRLTKDGSFEAIDYNKPIYSTRWYYQEPIYTYYYSKTEHFTDLTVDPTGIDGASNIVARIQCREK